MRTTAEFVVIGGGVIGLSLAREAKRRYPRQRVVLLEKERECGGHASGRNSGVLHAGFYYTADSLKARFTRDGNRALQAFCRERRLPLNRCGKLVVARDAGELAGLDELLRRARANGVELHEVSAAEARQLEPQARTVERALFSPTTATVHPGEVMRAMVRAAEEEGVEVQTDTRYLGRRADSILTSRGRLGAGYLINAAGLYADRVAHDYGLAARYRILPFKGIYLYAERGGWLRRHIYPVPELRHPFLGVHFTITVDGRVKIGPTAIPALWREHYAGLRNFRPGEFLEIGGRIGSLLVENPFGFRELAWREIRNHSRTHLVREAGKLVHWPVEGERWRWGRPGIRAQLIDIRENRLEMDFRYEGDDRSFHVLNAVSPAFTCSLPFCEYLFDEIERRRRRPTGEPAPEGPAHPVPSAAEQLS